MSDKPASAIIPVDSIRAVLGTEFSTACDCHVHINDPRYAYTELADLHPLPSTVADYRKLQAVLGTGRVVVVQPSSYGIDNRCTLDAVAQLGNAARAIVVIDEHTTEADIANLHAKGARGVRFNLLRPSPVAASQLQEIAARISDFGWHLQLHASADQIVSLSDALATLSVPVVFDHMGRIPVDHEPIHPAFASILNLLEHGRAWVKLSGAELDHSHDAPMYSTAAALARRYIDAAPERVVWGSNWPHPAHQGNDGAMPDDKSLMHWLLDCAPDIATQQRILLSNPASLYGFDKLTA